MTPEQIAKMEETDRFITGWLAGQAAAFTEKLDAHEAAIEKGKAAGRELPSEEVEVWMTNYDFGEFIRHRLPVGVFMDNADLVDDGSWKPSTKQLMAVLETGRDMVCAALGHPDATEEFLEEARSLWGYPVDAIMDGKGDGDGKGPYRRNAANEWV